MSAPLVGTGKEILSLHDHNFFHPDKHKYFHSGVEIVISLLVVVAFWEYTHHYLLYRMLKITVYMVLSFLTYKYMIRNDKTRQGFIVTLRTLYVELVNLV